MNNNSNITLNGTSNKYYVVLLIIWFLVTENLWSVCSFSRKFFISQFLVMDRPSYDTEMIQLRSITDPNLHPDYIVC